MARPEVVRVGEGAGTSRAWIEPAVELARHGRLDYLCFECLAERTVAFAQLARLANPKGGYDPYLDRRMRLVLKICWESRTRILTSAGAANPPAGGERVVEIARELGLRGLRVAVVTGDDVLSLLEPQELTIAETGKPLKDLAPQIVSANAYLGADPMVAALAEGAHVVVAGRVADPSLALAALRDAFGWGAAEWDRLGTGILVGHLTECGPQVTGGYFADPGRKDVTDLANIGAPIAECRADGTAVITKLAGTGGQVTPGTCTEQMLYEVHDPGNYLTPDVVADFSAVQFASEGADRVRVTGASGRPRPRTLKVTIGYRDGFIGETQLSYGGTGCVTRARMAAGVLRKRVELAGIQAVETRVDVLGVDSLFGDALPLVAEPPEARVRLAVHTKTREEADYVAGLADGLTLGGPYGGGGPSVLVREVIAVCSVFLPRELVSPSITVLEV
jgi:hypothetical protein